MVGSASPGRGPLPRKSIAALGLAALLLAAGTLSGCRLLADDRGLFVDPRDDYLQAKTGKPLTVPGGLAGAGIVDAWPIPDIVDQPVVKVFPTEAPRPAVLVGRDFDAVRIQRLGAVRWIVLGDPPAQVWPTLKQFLAESGVGIGREAPEDGVVDSAWLVVAEQAHGDVLRTAIRDGRAKHVDNGGTVPAGRDRVRFRVERGIRRGSTEVHVVHQRALGAGDERAPALVEVEAEVTAKLAEYFAAGVGDAVSMVGRDVATARKAELVKDAAGYPALRLHVGFDRAWATVGQALERAEIAMQADREGATYRAEFPTASTRGWLTRIVPGGGAGRDTPVRISVEREADSCLIRVATPAGEPLALSLAEEVLVTLREFAA